MILCHLPHFSPLDISISRRSLSFFLHHYFYRKEKEKGKGKGKREKGKGKREKGKGKREKGKRETIRAFPLKIAY